MGGHLTDPYEQNTQQSPLRGRSIALQFLHSWKKRQASVGMRSTLEWAQCGQVSTDSRMGTGVVISRSTRNTLQTFDGCYTDEERETSCGEHPNAWTVSARDLFALQYGDAVTVARRLIAG